MTSPNTSPPVEPNPVPDGGEEYTDYGEVGDERTDEYVEHYPDPFAEEEPGPLHDGYLPEYEPDPHLTPGLKGDDDPPWGFEEDSARPRGPPCESCDEYTRAESFGWAPATGETVDWAVCDDCSLGWGPIEGWVDLDEDGDPAIRTDGGTAAKAESAPSDPDSTDSRDAVEEIEEELERLAASDLPIAERAARSLERLRNGG